MEDTIEKYLVAAFGIVGGFVASQAATSIKLRRERQRDIARVCSSLLIYHSAAALAEWALTLAKSENGTWESYCSHRGRIVSEFLKIFDAQSGNPETVREGISTYSPFKAEAANNIIYIRNELSSADPAVGSVSEKVLVEMGTSFYDNGPATVRAVSEKILRSISWYHSPLMRIEVGRYLRQSRAQYRSQILNDAARASVVLMNNGSRDNA